MPARTARTKGRLPSGLSLAVSAPDECIKWVLLSWAVWIAATLGKKGLHLCRRIIGLVSKLRSGLDGGVDVWVFGIIYDVGRTSVKKLLDHLHDFINGLHGADIILRRKDGEQLHIGAEKVSLRRTKLAPIHAIAFGALKQWIIDIGDVLYVWTFFPASKKAR